MYLIKFLLRNESERERERRKDEVRERRIEKGIYL